MLFNSLEFLIFFVCVYGLYLILQHRWQNRLLILASLLFYAAWNWKFIGVMLISITTDYFCANKIDSSQSEKTRKLFLFLSIFVNLSILAFFKYFNFFANNLEALHIVSSTYVPFKIILPLGVSFYTFEAISYTVDVYRRQVKPAKKYTDYLLFVIYFPHLIAGPIMRAKKFLPQVEHLRVLSWEQFYEGTFLCFWGLFEKMFIADNLAKIVNPVFAGNSPYEGGSVLLALYAFSFQIFCDFDGYSNIARGLGKAMGFDITINFNLPYFSSNPREFWQRWHISLSTWLRDYLYIPLGGNRFGPIRMYLALLATMLLGGLWHGASWTFVVWGAYQGTLLIVHRIFRSDKKTENINNDFSIKHFLKIFLFFHCVVLGWLFFRAQSFGQILQMLEAIFANFSLKPEDLSTWFKFLGFISPLLALQLWQYKANDLMVLYKQNWLLKMILYALMTYLTLGWGIMKAEEFVYFQF